ncbi:hypothetical protein [Xanthobacter tagetidis]|uniref:hypothetical protein n=1 Tax=Xanthobacter tagetidis TaxID=60216 RepID=UPI0011C45AB8|nr:hypothetical protein [Xanthobacter tagetidis]MBB6307330.1 putative NUDIX family phosphoesterase [Xanthobacter tagetidis]
MADAETSRRINDLERLASKVLELKRRVRPRRPIVIEFAGSPKAGKTSALNSLDIFLRRNGFRTRILTERASVCPIPNKFDPVFNVWTGCAALNQLLDTISNNALKIDVIIMDRGFFDAICWFEWQAHKGLLRSNDFDNFVNFFLSPRFRMLIDLIVAFESDPETSIEREYRNLLTRKEGSVMRKDVLESYRDVVSKCILKYEKLFRDAISLNTNKKKQAEVGYEVTQFTLKKLMEIANEKIGYIPLSSIPSNMESVFDYKVISNLVENDLSFEDRNLVENNKNLIQIIPIAVIKQKNEMQFVVARKSEKALSSRSPERRKVLTWFGGHIRQEDSNFLPNSSSLEVIKQCLYREVKEEIDVDINPTETNPKCIWVRDGTRSECHLAIVFIIECDLKTTKITVDGEELVKYEKKKMTGTGEILTAREILSKEKIDSWSEIIIKNIIGFQNIDADRQTKFSL